jgi:hypothetical protein
MSRQAIPWLLTIVPFMDKGKASTQNPGSIPGMVNIGLIVGLVTSPATQGHDRETAQLCRRVGELRMKPIKLAKEAINGPVGFPGQSGCRYTYVYINYYTATDHIILNQGHHISKSLDIWCFVPTTIDIPIAVAII